MNPEVQKEKIAEVAFAHPAEREFARILNFYGLEWEYEPRTFPLEWDEQGNISEAFTPDFYLPQQDLYVEITTLRPQLSTHKNRKLKKIQELYPDINVKLYKRREIRSLLVKYGLDEAVSGIEGTEAQEQTS